MGAIFGVVANSKDAQRAYASWRHSATKCCSKKYWKLDQDEIFSGRDELIRSSAGT